MARRLCPRERLLPITSEQGSEARLARYREGAMALLIGQARRWHVAARCGVGAPACEIPVFINPASLFGHCRSSDAISLALKPIGLQSRLQLQRTPAATFYHVIASCFLT